ncbi:hypothetical protein [Pontibacillus yanchengensis]|uniref:hypothetical protein n=1 Tax=Pontibacillus yanchengensis TaxID=462910 RepID=UPI00136F3AC3
MNEWDVNLTKDIPLQLNVNIGASDTSLNLSGLQLSELSIHSGVGEMDVDLSGTWKDSFNVDLISAYVIHMWSYQRTLE